MNPISEIFHVALCIMLLCLMLSLAIKAHAQDAVATLDAKAEFVYGENHPAHDDPSYMCETYGKQCEDIEPASGDYVTPEWTPMGEQQGVDVMPEDVIVE